MIPTTIDHAIQRSRALLTVPPHRHGTCPTKNVQKVWWSIFPWYWNARITKQGSENTSGLRCRCCHEMGMRGSLWQEVAPFSGFEGLTLIGIPKGIFIFFQQDNLFHLLIFKPSSQINLNVDLPAGCDPARPKVVELHTFWTYMGWNINYEKQTHGKTVHSPWERSHQLRLACH